MDMENACEPVFARHESFHLRYGWLKEGIRAGERRTSGVFNE